MEGAIYVKNEFIPAKMWNRLVAFIIDQSILLVLLIPISNLLGNFFGIANVQIEQGRELPHEVFMYLMLLFLSFLGLTFFYAAISNLLKGGSPGKLAMKIRVVALPMGGNVGPIRTFVREVIGKSIPIFLIVSSISVLFRKDRRALHDLISMTIVIAQ